MELTRSSGESGWRTLGRAVPVPSEPGWYALDLRAGGQRPVSADNFDQLCFAGKQGPDHSAPVPVERSQLADGMLRVQITGALPSGSEYLWTVRLTPQHLLRKLREGIAAAPEKSLADTLAAGRLDPVLPSGRSDHPPGFLPAQQDAYQACVQPGLHAVWGPPGTGKTRVLARAIEDHVRAGRRVLLVSTANVAVDNALKEIVNYLAPRPGEVLRVGPPHLPELAANDDIQLHRLAARTTASVDSERQQVQDELTSMDNLDDRVQKLDAELEDYDHAAYLAARERIANTERLKVQRAALTEAEQAVLDAQRTEHATRNALTRFEAEVAASAPARTALAELNDLAGRLADVEALVATARSAVAHHEFVLGQRGGWLRRARTRRALAVARRDLGDAQAHAAMQHQLLAPVMDRCRTVIGSVTEEALARLDRDTQIAAGRHADAERATKTATRALSTVRYEHDRLVRAGVASDHDIELVADCERQRWPQTHAERGTLLAKQETAAHDRPELEARLRELTKRSARLRKDAEGVIAKEAKVIATTLARSRAHPAVAGQRYDVVLVDEVGAAIVADVLLAVSYADRTATLLGDFLQLGPVAPEADKSDDQNVRKWMLPESFAHCGIRAARHVADNRGCVGLRHQFRFGPNLRRLANDVVYKVLEDGVTVLTGRPPENTEIVVVDVDGLDGLDTVYRSGKYAGWWPVGALVSRSLVQHHAADSGGVGVVTTFKQQTEATLATLRDADAHLGVAVGTAHSFQGREFDSVVFDLVDDGRGWISKARPDGDSFAHNGVRLFGVGITRARKRLYLITSRRQAIAAATTEGPLGALRELARAGEVQLCRASVLLGISETAHHDPVSPVEQELGEVLRGLVDVTDVHDEFSFDTALSGHIDAARESIWMWSPWVAKKSDRFLPLIAAAVARGVDVRVFVRTEDDRIMALERHKEWVALLRDTGATVIRAEVEHRKVVIVDRSLVLLGSHNPLSQQRSREVMIACRGAAFAERMLDELHAETLGHPPACSRCGQLLEVRRSAAKRRGMPYLWRCRTCRTQHDVGQRTGRR